MITRTSVTALSLTAAVVGVGFGTAAPASAGGIGDFLSPAFGVSCANLNNGAQANGTTTQGTGAANGNLAGLPLGGALNQCGGADAPPVLQDVTKSLSLEDLGNIIKVMGQSTIL